LEHPRCEDTWFQRAGRRHRFSVVWNRRKHQNCSQYIHGLHDACVYAATGNVFVEANEMVQCADLGASAPLGGSLIRIGQGRARIQGNWGYRPSGAPGSAYRYGIQWDGATYSQRSAANNVWYNFGAAAETGTM
jgi:hypothetical protein